MNQGKKRPASATGHWQLVTGNLRKRSAFTLIELLVVVLIIGILASTSVLLVGNARIAGRDARRKADVKSIATALEAYLVQRGTFPQGADPTKGYRSFEEAKDGRCWGNGANSFKELQIILSAYIQLPSDPLNKQTPGLNCGYLRYEVYLIATYAQVFAFLENLDDPDRHKVKRYQTNDVRDCTDADPPNKGVKWAGEQKLFFDLGYLDNVFLYHNSPIKCP